MLASACSSRISDEGTYSEITGVGLSLDQFAPEEKTKLSVDIDLSTSVRTVLWEDSDEVGIFPDRGGYQLGFSLEGQGGSTTAAFDGGGWGLLSNTAYSAYFPFNYDNRDLAKIPVDYTGQTQDGISDSSHLGPYTFSASVPTSAVNGKVSFVFQQLGSLVWMKVTLPEPGNYKEFALATDPGADLFTLKGTYSLEAGSGFVISPTYQSNAVMLFLDNVVTTSANQLVNAYMMVAPADLTGHSYKFYAFTSDNRVFVSDLSLKNHLFTKGQYKTITINDLTESTATADGLVVTASGEDVSTEEDW